MLRPAARAACIGEGRQDVTEFHVGQKVVCIDDRFKHVSKDQGIRKGQIYTIRWVGPFSHYIDGDFIGVKLLELDRGRDDGPEGYGYDDMPFRATRFRPLVKDRIGSLRALLAPKRSGTAPAPKKKETV
ncbi:CAP-Gly domain protein [Ensifer soli]|uniref:CAP-Gly domain protein n=1 Tax=Ciceribacter sp. sgz301302 TaxID=3342379 RepID=UPI0035B735B6